MMQAFVELRNMMGLLDIEPIPDLPQAKNATHLISKKPEIIFQNVNFSYTDKKIQFHNFNLKIESGNKVAIVGASGAGKSTLVKLLYRFYQVDSGKILIDGHDIKNMQLESLRKQIGIVPQECVLFHDTIYHNIAYGDLTATEEQVIQAAKLADVHDTIIKQSDGYQSIVGERGLKLSGGEKQRVAIAKTMLKQPKILIYDEATSNLDSITEQNILKSLNKIAKDRTTIIIAHRLSTIMDCDEIIVLGKNGQVLQQGKHAKLLSEPNSAYRELWENQNIQAELEEKISLMSRAPSKFSLVSEAGLPDSCGCCSSNLISDTPAADHRPKSSMRYQNSKDIAWEKILKIS